MYHTSVPNDPEVKIKIDTSNVFNTTCRVLTLDDALSGRFFRDYVCGLIKRVNYSHLREPV
jgi:hypothetical protein